MFSGDLEHRALLREPANLLILNTSRSDTAQYRCEVAAIDDQKPFDEILISLAVRGTVGIVSLRFNIRVLIYGYSSKWFYIEVPHKNNDWTVRTKRFQWIWRQDESVELIKTIPLDSKKNVSVSDYNRGLAVWNIKLRVNLMPCSTRFNANAAFFLQLS